MIMSVDAALDAWSNSYMRLYIIVKNATNEGMKIVT